MRSLSWPRNQAESFGLFRVVFGLFLFVHFAYLIPYASELFGDHGMLASARQPPPNDGFPNLLTLWSGPLWLGSYLGLMALLALVFASGLERRICAILLWYGWASLVHRNLLIHNPSVPYVGWLLLACALVPKGEGLRLGLARNGATTDFRVPPILLGGGWLLLGVGYTLSGVDKLLHSPSWLNGDALRFILDGPLARGGPVDALLRALPAWVQSVLGYLVLSCELGFGISCLLPRTRKLAWSAMTALQLGILGALSLDELTVGMLMAHLFVLDPRWCPQLQRKDL